MKKRNIKKRLARAVSYSRTLTRVKHFRGRKVHSPFVYGIVRNAIMKTRPVGDDHTLFDELRRRGFSTRRAAQLQNLYTFRGFESAPFAENENQLPTGLDAGSLCFAMPTLGDDQTHRLVEAAAGTGAAICLVSPHESRGRRLLARNLVDSHRHTSVDNRGFLLIFTDERLPKQHFKL
jgi:hypothetical protein